MTTMSTDARPAHSAFAERDRAEGALMGLALGDALGMPTQSMSPADIEGEYGCVLGLIDASAAQPVAPSMPAGSITDDTEQALLLADLLVEAEGAIPPARFAALLLNWEDEMIARGSLDLLGPSTKVALEAVRAGADPTTTGKTGTTNGAAMRVTPIGIAFSWEDVEGFAEGVRSSCRVTHDTVPGFTSAALVAAAVSIGLDGSSTREAIAGARALVASLGDVGEWSPKAKVLDRLDEALALSDSPLEEAAFLEALRARIGTSVESNESIPCAFALAHRYADQPDQALLAAANLGGDTDTIGAIAGAVLGATTGTNAWPEQWWDTVRAVNSLSVSERADALLRLRASSRDSHTACEGAAR
ncbi:ADP-ribosylglycohydrolase family protein [Schaalia hyovaginalis]|uniref:ADP-ribosylglycohydrolase n=1 Tax=Schaalia hyovaginalis TaxID=29316 RepID=A0A923E6M4_9ACTO|nr:ADP-ribosylglycohydrolase family protein [Schaalia hyovaginalis]MBB6335625.1 ADP-ribosylglycohydrolase [Schaalia hyovaginalis]